MRNPTEGFRYDGEDFLDEINWIYSEELSTDTKLVFQAYDVFLFPYRNFSTWPETKFKQAQIDLALEIYKDFDGEIWLDDVRIKWIVNAFSNSFYKVYACRYSKGREEFE